MKKLMRFAAAVLFFLACIQPIISAGQKIPQLLTLPDAEKILGETALLTENRENTANVISSHHMTYTASNKDSKTGKTGAIYYLHEQHPDIAAAHRKYAAIKKANEGHEGVKVLEGLGDEAYFHSDGENFLFIMARKGVHTYIMKVNKITSHTSLEEFNLVARKIADQL